MDPDFRRDDGGSVKQERVVIAALAVTLLVAAVLLRTRGTLHEPLWLDEAYSAYAAGKSWAFLWQMVPRYETHPPFYYSLLRLWTLGFGDSLAAMRALGIACGLATLPVLLLCGREIARLAGLDARRRRRFALALLALGALSPRLIDMAREVRPYPVLILVYALAILALLRVGRRSAAGAPLAGRPFAAYLLCLALVLWLHNLGPLFAVSLTLGLAAMILRRTMTRGDALWLVGGHLLVGLVYLPALLIAWAQAPTWIHSTWLQFVPDQLFVLRLTGLYLLPGAAPILAGALLLLASALLLRRTGEGRRVAMLLSVAALLPVALSIAISLAVAPVFIVRTMTPVAVPTILLLGLGLASARWRWPVLAAFLVLAGEMAAIDLHARPPRQDWYGAVRWLAARHRPGDIVLAYPNEGALPFDRAVRDLGLVLPSRPIPTPVPSLDVGGWNPTGSRGVVSLPRPRLQAIAAEPALRAAPTIWLLRLGPNAYDKGDMFLDALSAGHVRVARFSRDPIDIVGLSARPAAPAAAAAAR